VEDSERDSFDASSAYIEERRLKNCCHQHLAQHSYTRLTCFDPFNWLIACRKDHDDDNCYLALYNKVLPSFKLGVLSVLSGANCVHARVDLKEKNVSESANEAPH